MENQINKLTIVDENNGENLSIAGGNYRIVISGKETGGAYATIEMLVPPQGGPAPHSHPNFQESFYVLDGEVEVKTEAGNYTASKGTFINIPLGGMVHSFKNVTAKMARLWCVVVPSGLEEMFREIGKPVGIGEFLPPTKMDEKQIKEMQEVAVKYGQKLFPPNYLD